MMRRRWILPVASAAFACLIGAANAFTFAPRPPKQCPRQGQLPIHDEGAGAAEEEDNPHIRNRRGFFSKVAATTAPVLLAASQASAVTNEPTRIELSVDTEYLIRVLEYFDGDMRKVLGVLVRSPQTTVEIVPPAKGAKEIPNPKDAILRALYSYESPDEYITQASWVKVDEPNKGWVEFLTKKRYRIYVPSIANDGNDENGILDVTIRPTNINLSNLEVGVGLAVLSYPVAYGYYQYESWWEEQESKARKAKIAAKNAAKAGAAKKSKGTPSKENIMVKAEEGKNPPALKGQATKKDGSGDKSLPSKKATTAKPEKDFVLATIETIEDQVAADMLDSQRANIAAAAVQEQQLKHQAELQSQQVERYAAAIEQQWPISGPQPEQDVNEMQQLIADAAQLSQSTKSAPGSGYLDNLSKISQIDTESFSQPVGAKGYLDRLSWAAENSKPKSGPSTSYLDSL